MILGNYTILNSSPGRAIGGFTNLYGNFKTGTWYSFYDPDVTTPRLNKKASFFTGTETPYSWMLPIAGGELSSTTGLVGTGNITAALTNARILAAILAGSGSIAGSLSLLSSITSAMVGSGGIGGNLKLASTITANLSGTGALSGSLNLLVPLVTLLTGTGTIAPNLKSRAKLEAHIYVNSGSATIQDLVDGVWSALASDYNVSGTMGSKMNSAGTAGDPWTTDLSGYTTNGTAGKIVKQIKSIGQANL